MWNIIWALLVLPCVVCPQFINSIMAQETKIEQSSISSFSLKENSPLIEVIVEGDIEWLNALIESGVDPNTKDQNGKTALMYASEMGRFDIVERLLKKGVWDEI